MLIPFSFRKVAVAAALDFAKLAFEGEVDLNSPLSYASSMSFSNTSSFFIRVAPQKIVSGSFSAWNHRLQQNIDPTRQRKAPSKHNHQLLRQEQIGLDIFSCSGGTIHPAIHRSQLQALLSQRKCRDQLSVSYFFKGFQRKGFMKSV